MYVYKFQSHFCVISISHKIISTFIFIWTMYTVLLLVFGFRLSMYMEPLVELSYQVKTELLLATVSREETSRHVLCSKVGTNRCLLGYSLDVFNTYPQNCEVSLWTWLLWFHHYKAHLGEVYRSFALLHWWLDTSKAARNGRLKWNQFRIERSFCWTPRQMHKLRIPGVLAAFLQFRGRE